MSPRPMVVPPLFFSILSTSSSRKLGPSRQTEERVRPRPGTWVVAPYYPWRIHHRSGRAKRLLVTAARPPHDDPLLCLASKGARAGR